MMSIFVLGYFQLFFVQVNLMLLDLSGTAVFTAPKGL